VPGEVEEAEMVKLFAFIGEKKNQIYIITIVDRVTSCYLGFRVVWQRFHAALQAMTDEAPKAKRDQRDALGACGTSWVTMKSLRAKPTPTQDLATSQVRQVNHFDKTFWRAAIDGAKK
jgi:hypothetical protein